MKNITPDQAGRDKPRYRQTPKGLRAAEARRQFELLEEQRLLQHHLADFWDSSLDKDGDDAPAPRKR